MVGHVVSSDVTVVPVGDEHRAVRCGADVRWAVPRIFTLEHADGFSSVARAAFLDWKSANDPRPGVAVHHLAVKNFRQQIAFVNRDAGRRALASLQQVWDDAGIVLVPVPRGDVGLLVGPLSAPARAGQFVGVAVVAELHHEVDAHAAIAVVVVVRLPNGAE